MTQLNETLKRMRESDFEFDWPFALNALFVMKRATGEQLEKTIRAHMDMSKLLNGAEARMRDVISDSMQAAEATGREVAQAAADEVMHAARADFAAWTRETTRDAIDDAIGRINEEMGVVASRQIEGVIGSRKDSIAAVSKAAAKAAVDAEARIATAAKAAEDRLNAATIKFEQRMDQALVKFQTGVATAAEQAQGRAISVWNNSWLLAGAAIVITVAGLVFGIYIGSGVRHG